MEFTRTGVFATVEEAVEIEDLHAKADNTPCMTFGLNHESFAAAARRRANERTQAIAMSHGLPDHKGYYGVDMSNREFIAPAGWIRQEDPLTPPAAPATL